MAKKLVFLGIALFLIVQSLFISAFDCNSVSSYDACIEIKNSDLSSKEKNLLIANLDYNKKYYPDHDYIYQRNIALEINNAPSGVPKQDGTYVRDAWLSIFSIMPSVLYNISLYIPQESKVLSGYNYQIEIPSDYYSSGYPKTSQGDCKRTYSLISSTAENKVYVNDNYQGSGELVNINVNSDSEIKAEYSINVKVDVNHYKWDTYCCKKSGGKCVKYCHKCKYSYDETNQDNIQINNTLNVKKYDNNLFADLKVLDFYSSNTKLNINYSNSIELDFQDSEYKFYQYTYGINYSKEPYYVYTLHAEDYNQEKAYNILKDEDNFLVKNTENCKIKAFDFFNSFEKECNLDYESVGLNIKTDKLKYKPGEIINVEIYPPDVPVRISYNDEIKESIGIASFTAKPLKNKITAEYNNLQTEAVIYVADKERFALFFNMSIFGVMNYFFYAVLRKYLGGLV